MQESSKSTWRAAISRAAYKTLETVFDLGKPIFMFVFVPKVTADFCFLVPGQPNIPYHLNCIDDGNTARLANALITQAGATQITDYNCGWAMLLDTYYARYYGKTAFRYSACELDYWQNAPYDARVDEILSKDVKNGIFGGYSDVLTLIGLCSIAAVVSGVTLYCLVKKKCRGNQQDEVANERTPLNSEAAASTTNDVVVSLNDDARSVSPSVMQ